MISFRNKKLLDQALQLPFKGKRAAYERLEFLGDRVVGLIVSEMLYTTFPKENEGSMAKRFSALTREETLAKIAEQIGLPDMLITNEDELRHNTSVLSDVCEAVMAAIYLDQGLEAVRTFMVPLWKPLIELETHIPQDAKSALQELTQKKYRKLPQYTLISQTGPDHNPIFTVCASVGKKKAVGEGSSKKNAELNAAELLLKEISS